MKRWYIAKTNSGRDHVALDQLSRRGFGVYCPIVVDKSRKEERVLPLFPGYIMVEFGQFDNWQAINNTIGVVRLLPVTGEIPIPLPVGFVEEMKSRESSGEFVIDKTKLRCFKGETVQIDGGAYCGFFGKYQSQQGGMVTILVNAFNRQLTARLPIHHVLKL